LLGHARLLLTAIMVLSISANAIGLLGPYWTGQAIDQMGRSDVSALHLLVRLLISLAILYLIGAVSQWVLSLMTTRLANRTVQRLRQQLFDRLARLPLSFLDRQSQGDIVNRMTQDMDAIAEGLLLGLSQFFSGLVTLLGALVFMFSIQPLITLIVIVLSPLSFRLAAFISRRSQHFFRESSQAAGTLNNLAGEMIDLITDVRTLRYGHIAETRFREQNQKLYTVGQKAQFYSSLVNPSTRFINHIAYVTVGVASALLSIAGRLTIGMIGSFLAYATQFAKPINEITSVMTQLQSAVASADRVFELLDELPEHQDAVGTPQIAVVKGDVRFESVDFAYTPGQTLIRDLDLHARPGSTIAIVGPTGAGKTTLVNLLMRFYEPDAGRILIDGQPIADMTRDSVRRSFAMVLQDTWLFSGSIRENIAYAHPEADLEEVVAAARAAHAHGFIRRLPEGYDTQITDGSDLSQGQRQLLTIARAMLADAAMLILDEATSSVDTRTEVQIRAAILHLMANRTSFVIAHRLSTIRDADRILVMKKGCIVERGTHEELMALQGFYHEMYAGQFENAELN
jgi:ATP-binding cassette subfamily B multidrug efflux pump